MNGAQISMNIQTMYEWDLENVDNMLVGRGWGGGQISGRMETMYEEGAQMGVWMGLRLVGEQRQCMKGALRMLTIYRWVCGWGLDQWENGDNV